MRLIARVRRLESAGRVSSSLAERLAVARKRATAPRQPPTRAELEAKKNAPGLTGRLARARLRCGEFLP